MANEVFHYTYGHKLSSILASGGLMPTGVTLPSQERKALWYSARQDFEPTALKPVVHPGSGVPIQVPFEELHELAGAYRFTADSTALRLKGWPSCCRDLGIMPTDAAKMVAEGIRLGASPTDWFATTHWRSLSLHRFQAWNGNAWVDAVLEEEVERRQGLAVRSAATGARWGNLRAG